MPVATVRLSRLFSDSEPPSSQIAFGRSGSCDALHLAQRSAALAAAIEKTGPGRWMVFTENSYAAAVSLIALAQTRSVAVLAPNRQPDTLRRLAVGVTGVILDPELDAFTPADLKRLAPLEQPPSNDWSWRTLDRRAPVAEFRTSGTTGDDRGAVKTLQHLEDEIETLENLFGAQIPTDARVFATVSHQHIYGLLFRVLWPLATGRPFQIDTLLHPEELLPRMVETGDCILASSPVHLKRMNATGKLKRVASSCRAIFSSGGALAPGIARGVAIAMGAAPIEILGSTETGGVAMRQRSGKSEAWLPFPNVCVQREKSGERLVVTSPFVSEGDRVGAERRRFTMGDRVELRSDGTFLLFGRADRIVKVGEKRLSLPDMERDLESHPRVEEAALVVLDRGAEQRVHAVVVLDEAGQKQIHAEGRQRMGESLSRHLSARWDLVLLPRVWRYVDALPRDSQGKLPRSRLQALFDTHQRDPLILSESRTQRRIERKLEIPDDLVYFQGHFEGFSVVAGVVQLRWAMDAARVLLGELPSVRGVEALKFPEPLLPGQSLALEVELTPGDSSIRFRLWEGRRTFATGRVTFGDSR
jgi:acyl-coenzyme A synthetase/AMP-(fatty) acid ligase